MTVTHPFAPTGPGNGGGWNRLTSENPIGEFGTLPFSKSIKSGSRNFHKYRR
jgi:hypothetical protein